MAGTESAQLPVDGVRASTAVELPADCRLGAQAALQLQCVNALNAGGAVLDGRAVERIDTAALQLLMLFRRDVAAAGGSWCWDGASTVLHEAASLLGLAQILEMPATVPA